MASPRSAPARAPIVVERIGLQKPVGDFYHFLLVTSWSRFFALIALIYVGTNALFAGLYVASPGCIENARTNSFVDAFFFSVQTMATIGYGKMSPVTTYANVLVTCESLLGMFSVALITGLTFAKFARPTARVLFSRVAVVSERDGVRSLMVRMANERATQIVDANLFMVLSISDTTVEGELVRRFQPLELTRPRAATFALTWTAIHPIDESSPLFGLEHAELIARKADILLTLTGIDETFAQTVHARTSFSADSLLFGHRFADIIEMTDDGRRLVHYTRFHDTIPMPLE